MSVNNLSRKAFPYPACLSIVFAASLLVLLSSCSRQGHQWKGTVEERDGIRIVWNPRDPIHKEDVFSLKEELSIGHEEGKEERIFTSINDIAVDANENIYLLDLRQGQIRVFDKYGNHLRNIGKRGQGPGEFQFPMQILISPHQELVICDLMGRRLFFLWLDGTFKRSAPTWKHGRLTRVSVDSEDHIIGETLLSGEKKGFTVMKFNPDLEELFTIAAKERGKIPILEDLSPRIVWSVSENDDIIWADSEKYEISVFDRHGKLVKKIIKEFTPERIIEVEYRKQISVKFGGRPIPPDFEQELPKYYPAFRSLEKDDQGRLLVGTYEKVKGGEGRYTDVFSQESQFIARIPLAIHPRIWKKGKIYTVEEDETGYPVMKRYGVTWKIN